MTEKDFGFSFEKPDNWTGDEQRQMEYVRMYRLAYSTPSGEFGTLIALAPNGEVWPCIVSASGWDNAAQIVAREKGGTLLAITPVSD